MQKPIANVFTWPDDDPALLGGKCTDCGAITFPVQPRCPRCGTETMTQLPLPRSGTLVSWTTQEFPPSSNYMADPTGKSFKPFGVGLVQLEDVVRVESRLTECDPQKLDFGMEVVFRVVPFYTDHDGNEVMTFAFAPVGARNSEER